MPRTPSLTLLLCMTLLACSGEPASDSHAPDATGADTEAHSSGDVSPPEDISSEDITSTDGDAELISHTGDVSVDADLGPDSADVAEPEEVDTAAGEDAEPLEDSASATTDAAVDDQATEGDDDVQPQADSSLPPDTGCAPLCEGVACGDDGCGGTCGGCDDGSSCDESGTCVDDTPSFEDQVEAVLIGTYEFDQMTVDLPEGEVDAQATAYPGAVDFISALEAAMLSFLTDDSDIESPLGIAYFVAEGSWDPNNAEGQTFEEATFEALIDHLNRPTASLSLVPIGQSAEHGESVVDAWIFHLRIDDMSDHLYWAIVDRQDVATTYNYGFN
jgi:hypothetical protein